MDKEEIVKVYVLEYREYDDVETMGVYSTKKRAEDMISVFLKLSKTHRTKSHFAIEAHRVDRPELVREYVEQVKLPRWVK